MEYDEKHTGLLCFEEPENGIHPFRVAAMAQLLKDLSSDLTTDDKPLRQVIVNTHSPVLVSKLIQWENDFNVSVWLCSQNSLITTFNGSKYKVRVTRIAPVANHSQLLLFSPPTSKMLTINEVRKILETVDTERAIKALEG